MFHTVKYLFKWSFKPSPEAKMAKNEPAKIDKLSNIFDVGKKPDLVEEVSPTEMPKSARCNGEQHSTLKENDHEKTLTVDKRNLKLQSCYDAPVT